MIHSATGTHVADVIVYQDPDGSPTIESFAPGKASSAWLAACHDVLALSLSQDDIAAEVPGLSAPYGEADIGRAIAAGDFTDATVATLYEKGISESTEIYLPMLEEIRV